MKISERGQITIPQRIRKQFGLHPSTEVELVEEREQLILRKRVPDTYPIDKSIGVLKASKGESDKIIEELRGR